MTCLKFYFGFVHFPVASVDGHHGRLVAFGPAPIHRFRQGLQMDAPESVASRTDLNFRQE